MTRLCVATYNVYLGVDVLPLIGAANHEEQAMVARRLLGELESTDFRERARSIVSALGSTGDWPDVVGFQEVCRWTRTGADATDTLVDYESELLAAFDEAGQAYAVAASTPTFDGRVALDGGSSAGVHGSDLTLVRSPEVGVDSGAARRYRRSLSLQTAVPGLAFTIDRAWSLTRLTADGGQMVVANTHLEAYDETVRQDQLEEVLGVLAHESGPAVLLGDLNAEPGELVLPDGWTDCWAVSCPGQQGATWGQDGLLRNEESTLSKRIDYVLARGADAISARVVGGEPADRGPSGLWPSDHAGLVVTLEW